MKARMTGTYAKEYTEGRKAAAQDIFVVLAYVLYKRGWKRQTIIVLLDKIKNTFDVINTGFMSVTGMAAELDKAMDIQMIQNSARKEVE